MRRLKSYLIIRAKKAKKTLRPFNSPRRYVHKNVPYFSQWESPELNRQIIDGRVRAQDDPKWALSGAKTPEEYSLWSWSGCGMACLKMILAHVYKETIPLVTLGKKCAEYGGYTYPLESSIGLLYKPFVKFVHDEYKLEANTFSSMIAQEIITALGCGDYVIAGVSPDIRYPDKPPLRKGGHLVLMLGYDLDKSELYLHNPSGVSKVTQEYAVVSFDAFEKFFSKRGIVIKA